MKSFRLFGALAIVALAFCLGSFTQRQFMPGANALNVEDAAILLQMHQQPLRVSATVPAPCITLEKVRADYKAKWPEFKLTELPSRDYMAAMNAQPPVSAIPAPEVLILVDKPLAPDVRLLAFGGGCFQYKLVVSRTLHGNVMRLLGRDI